MDKMNEKPPEVQVTNEDEVKIPDPLEDISICGVLLDGSNTSINPPSVSEDAKQLKSSLQAQKDHPDLRLGPLMSSVESVLAGKLGDRSATDGLQDGKNSFHVNIVVDDDEDEEEEEVFRHTQPGSRSTSMAIPSVPAVSRNNIASSPPIGKRAFASVAQPGITTSSLAAQIQHSLAALDDITHAESYTAEWIGSIQNSEHKPRIIQTPAMMGRSPPRLRQPIVPILPSSPSRLNQASESHIIAADSKHRHEAIMRIHASEVNASRGKFQDGRQSEHLVTTIKAKVENKPITIEAGAANQKQKGSESNKQVDGQKIKSPKDVSSPSKSGISKKDATETESPAASNANANGSALDADSKKKEKSNIARRFSSTKSCQTTDGSDNWHETEVPECSSSTGVCHQHLAKLGMFMLELYEHDRLTDVIVKVGSCTFSAHAIVLSCYSPVLAKIIKEGKKTKVWDNNIEIQDNVTPAAFQILLDYMYKGEIDIGCENLAEVLCAAIELRIESVRKVCEGKLDMLDASAALRVLETAHSNNIRDKVKEPMMKVICQGFQQICESPELQQLCVECLCDILAQDQLLVLSEYDVALAALHWLDMDTSERTHHLSQVIACVRLGHLSMDELFRLTDRAPYIMEDRTLRARLLEANWHQASLHVQRPDPSPSMSQLHPRNMHVPRSVTTVPSLSSSTVASQRSEIRIRREWLVNEARAIQAKAEAAGSGGEEDSKTNPPPLSPLQKSSSSESAGSRGSKTSVKVFEMKYGGSVPRYNSLGTLSTSIANEAKSISSKSHLLSGSDFGDKTAPVVVVAGSVENSLTSSSPKTGFSMAMTKTGDGQKDALVERSSSRPVAIPGTSAAHLGPHPDDLASPESDEGRGQGGGQFLVMVGGYKLQGEISTPVRSIHCYSNKERMWQTLSSSLPEPRAHHSIVYLNCFIYVIGGCNPTADGSNSGRALDSVYRVSTMDESGWTEMTPLTAPRMYHHSVVLDGDIYTLGGEDHNMSILDTVERYIPSTNRWQKRAPMLSPRLGCAATLWRGTIIVVGGIGGMYFSPLDTVEQYDACDDTWTYLVPLRGARVYPGLHVACGVLFLVGGLQDVGNELIPTAEVDRLVVEHDKKKKGEPTYRWEKVASMKTPRYDMACVADGDHLLILGGVSAFSRELSTVERYDVINQNWIPDQAPLPQALAGPRCFVANFDSKDNNSL